MTFFILLFFLFFSEAKSLENQGLLSLPKGAFQHISSFLSMDDHNNLRLVSKATKQNIEKIYEQTLSAQFGNKTNQPLPDLFTDYPEIMLPAPFEDHYTNVIIKKICREYLDKDGYLFVAQGSCLEAYLIQHYRPFSLYDIIKQEKDITNTLFNALFGKNIFEENEEKKEEKYVLALKLLTGCLPANTIYVEGCTKPEKYREIFESFRYQLLSQIQQYKKKRKYFLWGLHSKSTLSEESIIVVNQSSLNSTFFSDLDNLLISRTIILNADQESLSFPWAPNNMKNLILVNGDGRCRTIKQGFLKYNQNIQLCRIKGMTSIMTIENDFLFGCKNLIRFDAKGLPYVGFIQDNFLSGCVKLCILDCKCFTFLYTILEGFCSGCTNLNVLNIKYLRKVVWIGDRAFSMCAKLNGKKMKERILSKY